MTRPMTRPATRPTTLLCAVLAAPLIAFGLPAHGQTPSTPPATSPAAASLLVANAFMTLGRLQASCAAPEADPDRSLCLGYLEGVWDSVSVLAPVLASSDRWAFAVCLPAAVRVQDLVDLTSDYGRRHPEKSDAPAAAAVGLALLDRYACPDAPPPETGAQLESDQWATHPDGGDQ